MSSHGPLGDRDFHADGSRGDTSFVALQAQYEESCLSHTGQRKLSEASIETRQAFSYNSTKRPWLLKARSAGISSPAECIVK